MFVVFGCFFGGLTIFSGSGAIASATIGVVNIGTKGSSGSSFSSSKGLKESISFAPNKLISGISLTVTTGFISAFKSYSNGQKRSEEYRLNGKFHRTDGPANIVWYENGHKWAEEYFLNDKCHRTDGPANIVWHENGQNCSEQYHVNGKIHRTDGPANITYYKNGRKYCEQYYLNGQEIKVSSDLEFKKIVKLMVFK